MWPVQERGNAHRYAVPYFHGKAAAAAPNAGLLYSSPMRQKLHWPDSLAQIFFCVWLVAAQIWYYLQFKTLLAPPAKALLRSVWR